MGGEPSKNKIICRNSSPVEPRGGTYRENVELALPTQWKLNKYAAIAQLVEQGTENPCVLGSIPSCGIFFCLYNYYQKPQLGIISYIRLVAKSELDFLYWNDNQSFQQSSWHIFLLIIISFSALTILSDFLILLVCRRFVGVENKLYNHLMSAVF